MYASQKGAADYITKPFTRKDLLNRVAELVGRKKTEQKHRLVD
jgi:DNA-binding response OmpR family regulator